MAPALSAGTCPSGRARGGLLLRLTAPTGGLSVQPPYERKRIMGILTQAMTRLRGEIVSSRQSRLALRGALVRRAAERRSQVSALCAAFARDRAGARRAWFGRTPVEREAAEREDLHRLAEQAKTKARPERQPPATAEQEPRKHEPASSVRAPAERPPVGSLPPAQRTPFKGSRKH